jgi:hypothetical protein
VLPFAHVGHYWIWILYAIPILIVSAAIVKSFISQRQAMNAPPAGGDDTSPSPVGEGDVSETGPAGR